MRSNIQFVVGLLGLASAYVGAALGCSTPESSTPQEPIVQAKQAGSVGGSAPSHPCTFRLGSKPWEGNMGEVNPCTGNLSFPVSAGPMSLVYNSMDTASLGPAGYGIRLGIRDRLTVNGDNSVTRTLPNGEPQTYAPNGSAFTAPVESGDTLTHPDSNTYVIRMKGNTRNTYTRPNGTAWVLTSTTDRLGNTTTLSYDTSNEEIGITDPVGNTTSIAWSSGRIATVTNAESLVWTLVYDGSNQLTAIRAPLVNGSNPTETFAYDTGGKHLILTHNAPSGVSLHNVNYNADRSVSGWIDAQGRTTVLASYSVQVMVTDAFNQTTTYQFTPASELFKVIGPTGVSRLTNTYDGAHRLLSTTDWLNKTESFQYNGANDIVQRTDRFGKISTAVYDANHNVTSATDTTGKTTTTTYDANDLALVITDPSGRHTTHTRASNGNLLSTTGNDGTTMGAWTYGSRGQVLTATDENGRVTTYTYDAYLNRTSVQTPDALTTTQTTSRLGRPLSTTNANNEVRSWTYDAVNRPTGMNLPNGGSITRTLDVGGRPTAVNNNTGSTALTSAASYAADGRTQSTSRNSISDQTGAAVMNTPPAPSAPMCMPMVCQGGQCGTVSNGCGGTMSCGMCGGQDAGQDAGSCGALGASCSSSITCCSHICNVAFDGGAGSCG